MVENQQSQHNVILNEGDEIYRIMSDQVYLYNSNVQFPMQNCVPTNLIGIRTFPCLPVPELIEHRTGENSSYFQTVWNEGERAFQTRFLNENRVKILTDQINNNDEDKDRVLEIADSENEEDDVVFVKAYQDTKPRRNPFRKSRESRRDSDEHIYEPEFCLLDSTDGETSSDEVIPESTPSTSQEQPEDLSLKDIKEWPANGLHERPKFNETTQQIEKFDYTLASTSRAICQTPKRPRLNQESSKAKVVKKTVAPAKKYAPKKKYVRKSRRAEVKVDPKVAFNSLKDLIQDNTKILDSFIQRVSDNDDYHECHEVFLNEENSNSNEPREKHKKCVSNYEKLVINQRCLYLLLDAIQIEESN